VVSKRGVLIWSGLATAVAVPVALAAASPLHLWRDATYIAAGFAGIAAMVILLFQPLLAAGFLPGLPPRAGRRLHGWAGLALVVFVILHVGGLWIASPADVMDALLFESPTPFSVWGVIAMWATFAAALLALLRRRFRLRPRLWRLGHTLLVLLIAIGSVIHALLIEGAMEPVSKALFCAFVLGATAMAVAKLRVWVLLVRRKPG
jgi:predicted ferric reductase